MAEAITIRHRPAQGSVTPQGTLTVYEPGTGKLLGEVRVSSASDVRETVQQARAAQTEWARKPFAERRAVLLRFKELLLARAEEFCEHITRENGKTRNESLFMEVLPVADAVQWYATHTEKALRDQKIALLRLDGAMFFGVAERISAVLWYSDLRGFTQITDTEPKQAIPLLNDYSDAIFLAIHQHGGDVLKLIGDGTLAIFTAADRLHACSAALAAAESNLPSRLALRIASARPSARSTSSNISTVCSARILAKLSASDFAAAILSA